MVKVHLGPRISVTGLMYSQVWHRGRWHARDPGGPLDEFSAECTSMFLKLKSRLYATKGCYGKMSRVCWSVERILKFWIRYRLTCMLNGWYVRTKGTLSVVVSACSDPLRASGLLMAVTLRRCCPITWITTLVKNAAISLDLTRKSS